MIAGEGFVLTGDQAASILGQDKNYVQIIKKYISGEDVNSNFDCSASRWVIDFGDSSEDQARTYPLAFSVVDRLVKPQRIKGAPDTRTRWWQFARRAVDLYEGISGQQEVLVNSEVSKYLAFSIVPAGMVFASTLIVCRGNPRSRFPLLQSTIHESWALKYSSTLETRLRYSPSDCFETFPFVVGTKLTTSCGQTYYDHRGQVMLTRQEGLTKTYNRFHNLDESAADIQRLRDLHVEMDRAVADAYGWSDLDLGHGFHETKHGTRYTISESARREVLARLLKLNHERHTEEVRQGLHDKKSKSKSPKPARTRKTKTPSDEPSLFGDDG
jgi:hypothetical protein